MKPASLPILAAMTLATAAGVFYQQKITPRDLGKNHTHLSKTTRRHPTGDITSSGNATPSALPQQKHPYIGETEKTSIGRPSLGNTLQAPHDFPEHGITSSQNSRSHAPPRRSHDGAAGAMEFTPIAAPVRTLQLAANFQLPAALLATISTSELKPDSASTPVENATQAIVDDFYRDLANRLPEDMPSDLETIPAADSVDGNLTETDGDNMIILPNPETDAVRRRADELYRTFFGDEAFGRKGMESTLEVRLPVAADASIR